MGIKKEEESIYDNIYFIFNKGAAGSSIFLDITDYVRFAFNFLIFQNSTNKGNTAYYFLRKLLQTKNIVDFTLSEFFNDDNSNAQEVRLTKVFALVIMPCYFCALIKSSSREKISLFLKKICASYSLYFNNKYKKTGAVFEGRYKSLPVSKNNLVNFLHYIHTLPLELKNSDKQCDDFEFLKNYSWSSHLDYCGWNNFQKIIEKDLLWNVLNGPEKYKENLIKWLSQKEKNIQKINNIIYRKSQKI